MSKTKRGTVVEMLESIPGRDRGLDPPVSFATMRDFFAAHALAGIVTRSGAFEAKTAASLAFSYADAMLVERINSAPERVDTTGRD